MRLRGWHHAATLCIAIGPAMALAMPTFDAVKAGFQPSDTLVLDRTGQPLHRLRTDTSVRRGQWLALAEVSPALRHAMLLSEDQRFYEHSGIDWRAVSAAAWGNLWNRKTRGASTITMQLAGLLDTDLQRGPGGRSVVAKLGQTVAAQRLERGWRKDQILEAWLNLVPLRGELVGIDALSHSLFGKAAHGLDTREAAVAAALVRAPNAAPAVVAKRACGVLQAMDGAAASCAGLDLFTEGSLQRRAFANNFPASAGLADHAARQLLHTLPGPAPATVRSSLDAGLQRLATEALHQQLRELHGRQVHDGAVLVLDNRSGAVRAWVGSSGELSASAAVDNVLALRPPGSTLKPFLYAQALAERRLTAASLLDDAPTDLPTASGLYMPQNYDHRFKGLVSLRTALGASLN
ncbi:MAG TPA: transglycosylase domain-containing protein, partial [Burkholderiaceae bacterium]